MATVVGLLVVGIWACSDNEQQTKDTGATADLASTPDTTPSPDRAPAMDSRIVDLRPVDLGPGDIRDLVIGDIPIDGGPDRTQAVDVGPDRTQAVDVGPDQGKPSKPWAEAFLGADEIVGAAVDSAGNSYVAGSYKYTASFGTLTVNAVGQHDVYVAKLDPAGNALWAVSGGGRNIDFGQAVAVDAAGNSYVTGQIYSTAAFGSITLVNNSSSDLFVAKVTPAGTFGWAISAQGSQFDGGAGLAVDSSGDLYVTGWFRDKIAIGSTTLAASGTEANLLVLKLDSSGKLKWASSSSSSSGMSGGKVAVDGKGRAHVAGYFSGTWTVGSNTFVSGRKIDSFVAKLDASGKILWAFAAGSSSLGHNWPGAIALDSTGNSYVTGQVHGKATFGSTTLTASTSGDAYVVKLDSSGKPAWARTMGGSGGAGGAGLALDSGGNVYLSGWYKGKLGTSGTILTARGNSDIYVARLDPAGKLTWIRSGGGTGVDLATGLALHRGEPYVTGTCKGTGYQVLYLGLLILKNCAGSWIWKIVPGAP
jgi:hypothetical protein